MADPANPELTPEELQCLLHDESDSTTGSAVGLQTSQCELAESGESGPRGELVTPDAIVALESLTRQFADRLSDSLAERMQTDISTDVTGFAQANIVDFVGDIQQPACLLVVDAPPLSAPFYWEWSPQILFPLLDRLLGGGELPPTIARRPLTEIEQRLVISLSEQLLDLLAESWQPAVEPAPRLDRIESSPDSIVADKSNAEMWIAEIQIDMGTHQGPLRIAYDMNAIAKFGNDLVDAQKEPPTHSTVCVVLAESQLDKDELLDLGVGDLISTDANPNDQASIYIDDEFAFHGVPGAQRGKKAVRIA